MRAGVGGGGGQLVKMCESGKDGDVDLEGEKRRRKGEEKKKGRGGGKDR